MNTAELAERLDRFLRPETFPLAIRMLTPGETPPPKTRTPGRDLGVEVAVCQSRTARWFDQQDRVGHGTRPDWRSTTLIKGEDRAARPTPVRAPVRAPKPNRFSATRAACESRAIDLSSAPS